MAADHTLVIGQAPLTSLSAARDRAASTALVPSVVGPVGLELEFHLVDLARPARRVTWAELEPLVAPAPDMPAGSTVTVEPGGQLELSTPPQPDVVAAVRALRRDHRRLADAVRAAGFGLASIGTDPARAAHRVNPADRYVAMERHFDALAYGRPGREMMTVTAALQVNLNAGPPGRWAERIRRLHQLGPVLVALSACSPLVAGHASGWHSMRQQIWSELDQARCRPLPADDPADGWASYALRAPVMLVRDPVTGTATAVTDRVPFASWVTGDAPFGRAPTLDDLDTHLSTLFPPIRLRGYLEVRCLDAVPERWWPALAALTVTLTDDEVAASAAAELCANLGDAWTAAARDGFRHPAILAAAQGCVDLAARRCPEPLRPEVEAYADLVMGGRTPGDELRDRAAACGPSQMLAEVADA